MKWKFESENNVQKIKAQSEFWCEFNLKWCWKLFKITILSNFISIFSFFFARRQIDINDFVIYEFKFFFFYYFFLFILLFDDFMCSFENQFAIENLLDEPVDLSQHTVNDIIFNLPLPNS